MFLSSRFFAKAIQTSYAELRICGETLRNKGKGAREKKDKKSVCVQKYTQERKKNRSLRTAFSPCGAALYSRAIGKPISLRVSHALQRTEDEETTVRKK